MAMGDVLVIGAGPFGLSISAHLRHRGVEHTIVGRPMDTWRAHMPLGLFLKSEPYGSTFSSAAQGYDIATYARLHGFDDYVDRIKPLSLERFLGYADWFTDQLVPDVRDVTVTSVTPDGGGFKVEFAEESPVLARQVIIATGLLPYTHIPSELSGLPSDLMTHSSAHRQLDQFSGRRVAVIGGGQSALQTGALLHEAGADVQIIVRREQVVWNEPLHPEIRLRDYIMRPPAKLCEGWGCVVADSPTAFRLLPESIRVRKALTSFGPHGAWWLRDRVEGVVEVQTGHRLRSAEPQGSGVRLHLDGPKQSSIEADHVIAGTGFRIDLARLSFLSEGIQAGLVTRANLPLVNRAGESTIPGLYFAGAPTMISLGPGVRFVSGTHHTAARLARSVARRAHKGTGPTEPAVPAASPRPLAAASPESAPAI
jgi:pyruvate/2-oxoglutarate dehydrogenase complex dihydrolipoamide dehydrogenase (E3) component